MSKDTKEKVKATKGKLKKTVSKLKDQVSKNKKVETTDVVDFSKKSVMDIIKASDIVNSEKLKGYIEKDNMPKFTLNYIMHVYKTEVLKHSVLLIRMALRNGKSASFFVNTAKPVFYYQNGAYIIDSSKISEDISSGYACLNFNQDCSLPYSLRVDIEKAKEKIYDDEIYSEIVENINPRVLKATVSSNLIQQVMAGGILDKQIRVITIIMIINIVLTFILMIGTMINGFM